MRNNALSNQQELLDRAREWAGVHPIRAHADRSVSGDMEAIFGPGSSGEAAPTAASALPTSKALVRTIPVGKGGRRLTKRGRNAAIAGAGLLAVAGAAVVATQVLPGSPSSSPTAAQFEPLPQAGRTPAPAQPALAPEEMLAATEYEESFVLGDEAALPAPVPTTEPGVGVVPSARADAGQSSVAVANAPSPVAAAPVPRPSPPAVAPRAATPTRVAVAPPAPARRGAATGAPDSAGSGLASAGQRARAERVREARQISPTLPVTGARHLAGRIRDKDYPRAARRARDQGTVFVRFAVQPNGRVGGCSVTRSSGSAVLDATTCQLIQRRFRYEPARNAEGRPIQDVIVGRQVWWLDRNGPPEDAREADAPGGEQRDARLGSDRG